MAISNRSGPGSLNPESWQNQIVGKAMALAEKQIEDGTASSQVITQFLKMSSPREKLEQQRLEQQNELLKAQVDALQSQQKNNNFYEQVLNAFKTYSGKQDTYEDDADDVYFYDR